MTPGTIASVALCVSLFASGAHAHTPPAPASRPAEPPTEVTVRLGDRVRPIPGPAGLSGQRVQIGGRRAELRDGRWAFSDERVLPEIVAAAEIDGRWVFVCEDGLVAASDTFAGPLRVLGAVPGARRASSWTRGRLAVLTDGAFFTTDGASLTPAGATPAPARHAAFLDARTGAAVLADGGLVLTRDGAATWSPVDLRGDVALAVSLRDGALRVVTARGASNLSADGALTAAPPLRATEATAAPLVDLVPAWRAREPVPDHGEAGHVRLPDGTYLAAAGGVVRHLDATGRVRSERSLGFACDISRWGEGAAVHCGDLYRTSDGEAYEAIPGPPGPAALPTRSAVFADDGAGVAMAGACDAGPDVRADSRAFCVRDARGRWRDVALPDGGAGWSLLALRADELLLIQYGPGSGLATLDLARGELHPVTFEGVPAGPAQVTAARVSSDGAYVATVETTSGRWVARSTGGPAWRAVALPGGGVAAGFADARRGVAVGARFGTVWRTLDGGARWELVPTGFEASGEAHRLRSHVSVDCEARGCSVGGFLFLRGWGPVQPAAERVLAGAAAPTEPRDRREPSMFASLQCARQVGAPSPWLAAASASGRAVVTADHVATVTAAGPRVTLAWRGDGGAGGATLAPVAGAPFVAAVGFNAGALVVTERDLEWARGPSRRRLSLPWIAQSGGRDPLQWVTLPTPGGGLVAVSPRVYPREGLSERDRALSPLPYALAFELDAAGAVVARREVAVDEFARGFFAQGLGRARGRWGHVTVGGDSAVHFAPLRGGPVETLGALPAVLRPCAAAPARDAANVWLQSNHLPAMLDERRTVQARVAVELSGGAACVRDLVGSVERRATDGRSELSRLRADGGAMVGYVDDGTTRSPQRCEVTP